MSETPQPPQQPRVAYDTDDPDLDARSRSGGGGGGGGGKGECCKKFLKFLFSNLGLIAMVVAYSVAGGFIFEHLEKTNEKAECIKSMEKYIPMENDTTWKLWQMATAYVPAYNDGEELEATALHEIEQILHKFRTDVLELSYDGKNCTIMGETGGPGHKWSLPGALLFSVTVITTIGESSAEYCRGQFHT